MANHDKTDLKGRRQQEDRYLRNKHRKAQMKTAIRRVLDASNKKEAEPLYREAISLIDRLVNRGVIHRNTAARRKSAISSHLNALS